MLEPESKFSTKGMATGAAKEAVMRENKHPAKAQRRAPREPGTAGGFTILDVKDE